MLDACIQNFFQDSTLYGVAGGTNAGKFQKGLHYFKRQPRNDRKNMNIAVLSQGLLSGIVDFLPLPNGRTRFVYSVKSILTNQTSEETFLMTQVYPKIFARDSRALSAEIVYFSNIICRNCSHKNITLLKKVDLTHNSIINTQVCFTRERGQTVTKRGRLSSKVGETKK